MYLVKPSTITPTMIPVAALGTRIRKPLIALQEGRRLIRYPARQGDTSHSKMPGEVASKAWLSVGEE